MPSFFSTFDVFCLSGTAQTPTSFFSFSPFLCPLPWPLMKKKTPFWDFSVDLVAAIQLNLRKKKKRLHLYALIDG